MLLTDAVDWMMMLAGGPGEWKCRDARSLGEGDLRLWRAVGGGDTIFECRATLPPRARFWSRILVISEAPGSQFDLLRDRLGQGIEVPGPVACLALTGRRFHGHRGRPWQVVAGNLHLSVAFRDPELPARHGLAFTLLPAVAVVDAIAEASGGAIRAGIKWVNDVLVEERKTAGVLTTTQSQADRMRLVVLGIGVNVARAPDVPPSPFTPAVGCLRQVPGGETLTLVQTFWSLLDALARWYEILIQHGPGPLVTAYREASVIVGRRVRIWDEGLDEADPTHWPAPLATGTVREIARDLSLRIEGAPAPITRGRLAFEEACRVHGL